MKNQNILQSHCDEVITIMNSVKPLTQTKYSTKEAAAYFGLTTSQVSGYRSNYKAQFGEETWTEGENGKSTAYLSARGMAMMCVLTEAKSKLSKEVAEKFTEQSQAETVRAYREESAATDATTCEEPRDSKEACNCDGGCGCYHQITFEEHVSELEMTARAMGMEVLHVQHACETSRVELEYAINTCNILGISYGEAAIIAQRAIVEDKNIDSEILEYLLSQKRNAKKRMCNILKNAFDLLVSEKFNGKEAEAIEMLTNELRYVGVNFTDRSEETNVFDRIVSEEVFDEAMTIIHIRLAE